VRHTHALLLLLALNAAAAPLPAPRDRWKSDLKAMQGKWYVNELRASGNDLVSALAAHHTIACTVSGTRITLRSGGRALADWTYTAVVEKGVRILGLKATGGPEELEDSRAVFQLEGGVLRLAIVPAATDQAPPADFKTCRPGDLILTLRRP
jgi:uncharacterized protein (TIGR03067 family)